jgi:hypothetical protein
MNRIFSFVLIFGAGAAFASGKPTHQNKSTTTTSNGKVAERDLSQEWRAAETCLSHMLNSSRGRGNYALDNEFFGPKDDRGVHAHLVIKKQDGSYAYFKTSNPSDDKIKQLQYKLPPGYLKSNSKGVLKYDDKEILQDDGKTFRSQWFEISDAAPGGVSQQLIEADFTTFLSKSKFEPAILQAIVDREYRELREMEWDASVAEGRGDSMPGTNLTIKLGDFKAACEKFLPEAN